MPDAAVDAPVRVEFTAEELDLLRTALRLLRSTLGRDEASELHEVRLLLDKIEMVTRPRTA